MNLFLAAVKWTKAGASFAIRPLGCLVLAAALGACQPETSEQELLDRARLAFDQGDASTAVIDVKNVLQENPDNAPARRLLGEIYMFQQDPIAAEEAFERALAAAEDEAGRVLYARALLSARRGDRLLELDSQNAFTSVAENPRYLAALARAQAAAGELETARDSMDAALAAGPEDPYVTTANAFFLLFYSGDMERAQKALQDTLTLHPDYADAWSLLGGAQQMNGEFASAETSYARVAELNPYRIEDRLNLVSVRTQLGKTAEAEAGLKRLLATNPNHPAVNFVEGRTLLAAGDNPGALVAFSKVLGVLPTHPGSLYMAALANIGEGNFATALDQLNKFLAAHPDDINGRLLLAELHLRMGNPAAAERVARTVLEEQEMSHAAMSLVATARIAQEANAGQGAGAESSDLAQRMAMLQPEARDPSPGSAVQADANALGPRLTLAVQHLEEGRSAEAVRLLTEVQDDYPEEPALWLLLTEALLAQGDLASASEAGAQLLGLLPGDPVALATVARIDLRSGQFGSAENHLREALEVQPENGDFHKLLIDALMAQGKVDESRAALASLPDEIANEPGVLVAKGRIALAANMPEEAEPHLRDAMDQSPSNLTLLWLSAAIAAQGRNDEALNLLDGWLTDHPDDALVRNQLASAYLQQGRETGAREQYQEILERAPNNVMVLNNLAWLLREEDSQAALAHIEKAYELAPQNPQIMDTYAMIQLERGAIPEALALNQKALELLPDNPEIRYHWAMILNQSGEREEAIRILEELVDSEEFAQNAQAQTLLAELQGL